MGFERRIVPDFEVIVCAPEESFRWNVHEYPHHLAKWHYHPEYELHLIQHSAGEMMIGDYVGGFEAGSLVLTGPGVPHNWVSRIQPGERVVNRDMLIQFSQKFADKVAGLCPEFDAVGDLFEDAARGIEFSGATADTGRRLLRSIGSAHGAERLLLFLELMTILARNPHERRILSRAAPAPGQQVRSSEKIETAINFILEHSAQPIRLTQLSALCGMEATAFSRFFKKQTGHTFARYVNCMRVHAACNLLASSDMPVTDICFEVGFNNIANFNRQFVKICGRSPSAYRRDARRIGQAPRPETLAEVRV
ncbi:AraC family transcriptional regulator [Mesorhizobium sp. BR1-1-16]|uniref:helix-turn-helix domain-containing protein n=1 Tax=Mesorhizobium sp. BR1-1-16 TaxID=2876653 RepID=UPI001CC8F5A6|nr:AraC family transcriptional regulator [Mesorhizobium sp. BR1-1-16]MBZ9936001.1 AraC family transcriptional regulator [Mesorhizobium sp. BR1-1-16]